MLDNWLIATTVEDVEKQEYKFGNMINLHSILNSTTILRLEDEFKDAYNSNAMELCDPQYRTITNVEIIPLSLSTVSIDKGDKSNRKTIEFYAEIIVHGTCYSGFDGEIGSCGTSIFHENQFDGRRDSGNDRMLRRRSLQDVISANDAIDDIRPRRCFCSIGGENRPPTREDVNFAFQLQAQQTITEAFEIVQQQSQGTSGQPVVDMDSDTGSPTALTPVTSSPSSTLTFMPSFTPTVAPTYQPSLQPSTELPSTKPSAIPTSPSPSVSPTQNPTTAQPTTTQPTTAQPTTEMPTIVPTSTESPPTEHPTTEMPTIALPATNNPTQGQQVPPTQGQQVPGRNRHLEHSQLK